MANKDVTSKQEKRRLTAAWLNIAAAAFVSGGTLPLLHALVAEGWVVRVSPPAALAVVSITLGMIVHVVGRSLTQEEPRVGLDSRPSVFLFCSRARGAAMDEQDEGAFPTERDVDEVLEEFGGDARAAVRALLHDLDLLASDYDAAVSKGFVRCEAPRGSERVPLKRR